ncbi:hypothetical protein CVT25_001755 [Psilocybe cyanescens]|uniref:F-box domain-containing protein n=1 Tax=Psilocybe cyanescens TaxID=93625 RepID=A0A409WPS1_PSICY|nr:hypothetical protein CVT25_001755 [Psilocybe cyanescens]
MNPFSTADSKLEALWKDLAEVDEELSILHKQVEKLAAKRKDVQREINRRLSLINRLPFEAISRILVLSIESDWPSVRDRLSITTPDGWRYWWSPLILPGAVCREWREITLALPHLWSTVIIRPHKQHTYSDITDEWLQRSGALPLSIKITIPENKTSLGKFEPISRVLRSHSRRWKFLTFDNVPQSIFYSLLDNLEDTSHIETIRIHCGEQEWGEMQPSMGEPIRPKTFHWLYLSSETGTAYFKWDNLTHLVAEAPLRDVIYHLNVDYFASAVGLWHPRFPNITHLKLNVRFEGATTMMINLLELLAYDRDEMGHPSLQVFELTTASHMTPTVWSHFINLFPQILAEQTHHKRLPTNSSDTDLTLFSDSPLRRRLSKACIILDHRSKTSVERDVMELHQYLHLLDIQKSGVELELIGNSGVDFLQLAGKIYGSELEARHKHQLQIAEEDL